MASSKTKEGSAFHLFGIRHHGPGSAKSLCQALEQLQPDCLVIEGPEEAKEVISLLMHPQMKPPVALLGYVPTEPKRAAYYPFVVFSPEWQALQYSLQRKIPIFFMDLPWSHQFALDQKEEVEQALSQEKDSFEKPNEDPSQENESTEISVKDSEESEGNLHEDDMESSHDGEQVDENVEVAHHDPLKLLAEAAGYNDSERFWEHLVEQRQNSTELFAAILEAMTALRKEVPSAKNQKDAYRESLREAFMRQTLREVEKQGFSKVAVVCGAWHAPILVKEAWPAVKEDQNLLKNLPKLKIATTWIPWTYSRLAFSSGYGAGVESPGWYDHLWQTLPLEGQGNAKIAERWLTQVARLLREEGLEASSAQTIEAVRLAEALAALRGRPLPGLPELNESSQALFCFGSDLPLKLIQEKLIIGERLGQIPDETPMIPLQQDLQRLQKSLRLTPKASQESLELDLRKETDLARSHLFHRLNLLGIPWGDSAHASGKGTFKEAWRLQWKPEFSLSIIEAARFGNTLEEAASTYSRETADKAQELPILTDLVKKIFLCELPRATAYIMERLQNVAAISSDVAHLMDSLPPLVQVYRYGNVRQTDTSMVAHILDGLINRICIGLFGACGSLNEEASAEMFGRINQVHESVTLLQNTDHIRVWQETLNRLADAPHLSGLIAGRAVRLLLDTGIFHVEEAAKRLSLVLSMATDPQQAASWVEGFLKGSGQILIHDEALWNVLDEWVRQMNRERFIHILPLLRRTFCTFTAPERRQMGERAKSIVSSGSVGFIHSHQMTELNTNRAESVLPVIIQLLGLEVS